MLETGRLILRRWEDSDAEDLFRLACDPDVGPIAGWPPHQSVEESREVIKNVFNGREAYAISLKKDMAGADGARAGQAIGAIELKLNGHTDMTDRDDECELGYWLGKPFWGQGIMPEAAREMLRHAFEDCGMRKVWCGYYEGNHKSKRVQEKCGFKYQWKSENVDVPLMREKRTGHVNLMTREDWEAGNMKKYIAYCGLDCEACEARLATVNNDDDLRVKVAKEWSELNRVEITPEMINCDGCRIDGVKTPYCDSLCPIRQCGLTKGFETCGSCAELETCEKAAMIIGNNEEALCRLKGDKS